jgi:dGTPase
MIINLEEYNLAMEWSNLLNTDRRRPTKTVDIYRNEFEKDYDRMISFSSVRRLQDKTQVFPLQTNDYTRTRLTHSHEVAALGKSMGKQVAMRLGLNSEEIDKIQSLLNVACLVHDLGNPPFGHFGEDSIKLWFTTNSGKMLEHIDQSELNDFLHFDGNPQTFRILTKLQYARDHFGANFTFGSLATLIKYPSDSSTGEKFGYFKSEKTIFDQIWSEMKISNRHPLTYLLEAADDIANSASDVEDAIKKGVVSWDYVLEGLEGLYGKESQEIKRLMIGIDEVMEQNKAVNEGLELYTNFGQQMKVWAQGIMLTACMDVFIDENDNIMSGQFEKGKSLIEKSSARSLYKFLTKKIAKENIYTCSEVMKLELLGHNVITGLLDIFINATIDSLENIQSHSKISGKIYRLISSNFRHVIRYDNSGKVREFEDLLMYERIQLAIDFVVGMTDTYALELFQQLTGVRRP